MTGRTLLASLLTTTALAALPGAAGAWVPPPVRAPACHRSAAPHPRVVATRTSTSTGRAASVACDRSSGHRRTLRHGWVGDAPHRFPLLSTAAAQGTKVSWSELDGPVTHLRQDLRTADVRHAARRQARRQIGPAAGTTSKVAIDSDPLQVLALPGDALAYVVYGGPRDAVASALAVYRPGRPLRVVTKTIDRPARVDDGRTLVWLDRTGYHSLDTASVPRDATGCPVRRAFRDVALDTPDVRVTAASDTGFILDQELAVRVCWKATGRDAIALTLPEETTLSTPIVATGPFVAVTEQGIDRYQSCYSSSLPSTGIYAAGAGRGSGRRRRVADHRRARRPRGDRCGQARRVEHRPRQRPRRQPRRPRGEPGRWVHLGPRRRAAGLGESYALRCAQASGLAASQSTRPIGALPVSDSTASETTSMSPTPIAT
jgi:hypothetical protein